jgi:type IV pilus assembly protein PilB
MTPKRLADLLIEGGLVDRFVIDQAVARLKKGEALGDRLVNEKAIGEADLLRVIARETHTRFVSAARLAGLQLPAAVLELIPLASCQAHDALPFSFDAKSKTVTIVLADPASLSALDDLPTIGNMNQVIVNVALPSAIRAAVSRLHRVQAVGELTEPIGTLACPQCTELCFEDQLECSRCGLLLNANAPSDNSAARLVRALISHPTGERPLPPSSEEEEPTQAGFTIPVTDDQIPSLVAGLDIARSLSDFEAFVVSFIDGRLSVGALSRASGLTAIEVHSVVASLTERKVFELRAPKPKRAPKRPGADFVPPQVPEPAAALQGPRHLNPQVQMESSLQAALTLEKRGQIDGAISVLRTAVSRSPNPGPLYNRLALVILNQRHDARQAEELLNKAIDLEPDNAVYKANLVKVLGYAATQRLK